MIERGRSPINTVSIIPEYEFTDICSKPISSVLYETFRGSGQKGSALSQLCFSGAPRSDFGEHWVPTRVAE